MTLEKDNITGLPKATQDKWFRLLGDLQRIGSVVVAFSGGVDSGLLSTAAYQALGDRMLAVTVNSPVNAPGDVETAVGLAQQAGFHHQVLEYDDLQNADFVANPADRCYHCKLARLRALQKYAQQHSFQVVVEGSNADDGSDYRPGSRAVAELGVRSPLAEAGLLKSEIRLLAKVLGLSNWDRPSAPCLATRFPYGMPVTQEGLAQVAKAEAFLLQQGFSPVRVRHLGSAVRIEVAAEEIARLVSLRDDITTYIKGLGFRYVTIDLQGYRQGSMNEVLST
jgi:pyridinium-3,5-biscarboxylic acid mononucleotide sulfurtransferase